MFISESAFLRANELRKKDSSNKYIQSYVDGYKRDINNISAGDYMEFGSFCLCNSVKPPVFVIKCPIVWQVLDRSGSKLLLLSKQVLDWTYYNFRLSDNVDWANSMLRKELNENYINEWFDNEEQNAICTTQLGTTKNFYYGTSSSGCVSDRLFLLSAEEVLRYFDPSVSKAKDDLKQACKKYERGVYYNMPNTASDALTLFADIDYGGALKGNIEYDGEITIENSIWWLRTPGSESGRIACGYPDGFIFLDGFYADSDEIGLRPAMWIDIETIKQILDGKIKV